MLGLRSAFEVYFGRKSNELLQCGKSIEKDRKPAQACLHPLSQIISDKERKTIRAREAVKKRKKEVSNGTVNYFRQRDKCSQYLVCKRGMLRLGKKKRKRVSRKYYAVLVKISKIGKHGDNYKVIFKNPGTKAETTEWVYVEDLADLGKTPKKGKIETVNEKYRKFLKPILLQDRYESFQEQGF